MRRLDAPTAVPLLPVSTATRAPLLEAATVPVLSNRPATTPSPKPKATVTIIPELCKGCELCVYACPSGNLTLSPGLNSKGYHPAIFNYNGQRGPCTACGICYWVCPDMAISEIRRLRQ